jgi:hypothetical protein
MQPGVCVFDTPLCPLARPPPPAQALGKEESSELDAASISFTTTDVDGALCVAGVTLQKVGLAIRVDTWRSEVKVLRVAPLSSVVCCCQAVRRGRDAA